jgi:hypothetical protein
MVENSDLKRNHDEIPILHFCNAMQNLAPYKPRKLPSVSFFIFLYSNLYQHMILFIQLFSQKFLAIRISEHFHACESVVRVIAECFRRVTWFDHATAN